MPEIKDDNLSAIVVCCFGESQGHVDVDLLQRTIFGEGLIIVDLLGVLPTDEASELGFLLRGRT